MYNLFIYRLPKAGSINIQFTMIIDLFTPRFGKGGE